MTEYSELIFSTLTKWRINMTSPLPPVSLLFIHLIVIYEAIVWANNDIWKIAHNVYVVKIFVDIIWLYIFLWFSITLFDYKGADL